MTSSSAADPKVSNSGWKEVPMPKIIQERTQSKENTSGPEYQVNDYLIAARVGYFNQAKKAGLLHLVTEGGNPIPASEAKKIDDLDPTMIKAIAIQESHAGANGEKDLLTVNYPGDWSATKTQKAPMGMKKGEEVGESNSLYYGIRLIAGKGFRGGVSVEYDNKAGTTTTTYSFKGWLQAAGNYNGGGVKGYQDYIKTMVNNAVTPTPSNY